MKNKILIIITVLFLFMLMACEDKTNTFTLFQESMGQGFEVEVLVNTDQAVTYYFPYGKLVTSFVTTILFNSDGIYSDVFAAIHGDASARENSVLNRDRGII